MKKQILFVLLGISMLYSCKHDPIDGSSVVDNDLLHNLRSVSPTGDESYYLLPSSTDLSEIPQDPKNPLTWEKVELGKLLFFETGLALDAKHESSVGTYSCSSCHVPEAGFLPCRPQGVADGGIGFGYLGEGRSQSPRYLEEDLDVQGNRPRSLVNVAFVTNTTWNGQFGANNLNIGTEHLWDDDPFSEVNHLGYHGLESQNIEGLQIHRMVMNREVADTLGYKAYYDQAFPDFEGDDKYSLETTSLAISAFLRTVLANKAPFQEYLKGDRSALSEEEKRGAILFFGKARCTNCHKSPSLNSNEFHALGVKGIYQRSDALFTSKSDPRNLGRGGFTKDVDDYYKFQVPQLYNLKNAGFYFHGSSKQSLAEVVEYKDKAVGENPDVPTTQISTYFQPVGMTEQEKADLTSFLENALYDPSLNRYMPPFILSGNCFPNNDPMSRDHLGCD